MATGCHSWRSGRRAERSHEDSQNPAKARGPAQAKAGRQAAYSLVEGFSALKSIFLEQ